MKVFLKAEENRSGTLDLLRLFYSFLFGPADYWDLGSGEGLLALDIGAPFF